MVANESQRTHMSFYGLSDVFGALGTESVACEVEGSQCPLGGVIIAISINNSS